MLVTVADVILPFVAEAYADADKIAKLEAAAELAFGADRGRGQEMEPNPQFRVRRRACNAVLLEAKHRRKTDFGNAAVGPGGTAVVPVAEVQVPVAAHMPVARLDQFLVPIPLHADAI